MISVAALRKQQHVMPPRLVVYKWGRWWREGERYAATPKQAARDGRLLLNSGTIHSALHFAWLCGAKEVAFIGCGGRGTAYDKRIQACPGCVPKNVFGKIRRVQDGLCKTLGLDTRYIGEPEATIPHELHFIWFGDTLPPWLRHIVNGWQSLLPHWRVWLWRDLPREMPDALTEAAADAPELCSRSDVLSYWLLWQYGGIYLDTDILPVQSLDGLCQHKAFAARQRDNRVNCAALGSVPMGQAMGTVLRNIGKIAAGGPSPDRTVYGPRLLTQLFGNDDAAACGVSLLPTKSFYPLHGQVTAHRYWKAETSTERAALLPDKTGVYGVHLWGVEGSSKRKGYQHGDALVYRLRRMEYKLGRPLRGAEVGVFVGRLSQYILRSLPTLQLIMLDQWCPPPPGSSYATSGDKVADMTSDQHAQNKAAAMARVQFALSRVQVMHMESADAAVKVAAGSLDFVFIDADHTYAGCLRDIGLWYPKVRPGGLVAGHDIDNPICDRWGVRRAVSEYLSPLGVSFTVGGGYTWFATKPEVCSGAKPDSGRHVGDSRPANGA
jgi:hypothetical protein